MPAVTLRQSTPQISQNCGVFQAWFRWTLRCVTIRLVVVAAPVQPAGFQPLGATRKPKAPAIIATK